MATLLMVTADGWLDVAGQRFRCALGRGGVVAAEAKREGDGATPAALMPLVGVYWRADRLRAPDTRLPLRVLTPADGWCDDAAHPDYNRLVALPHPARHEVMWREDGLYDIVVELGWNDDPVVPGRGSAIFLHCARPDFAPTEGCVALARLDLETVLRLAGSDAVLAVEEP